MQLSWITIKLKAKQGVSSITCGGDLRPVSNLESEAALRPSGLRGTKALGGPPSCLEAHRRGQAVSKPKAHHTLEICRRDEG